MSIVLLVYRSSRPNVAVLGRVPGTADQYGDVERHPENTSSPGRRHPAARRAACSSPTPTGSATRSARRPPRTGHPRRRPRPRDRPRRGPDGGEDAGRDPRGAGRARRRLVYARDVGQVRDVLRHRRTRTGRLSVDRRRDRGGDRAEPTASRARAMTASADDPATDPEGDVTDTAPDRGDAGGARPLAAQGGDADGRRGIAFSVLFAVVVRAH